MAEDLEKLPAKDRGGDAPLHQAIVTEPPYIVSFMLKNAADVDVKNESGETGLIYATAWGEYRKVRSFVRSGANINAQDEDGRTPLHVALNHYFPEERTILLFIKKGAEINIQDKGGNTPLHCAVRGYWWRKVRLEITEMLIKNGADVNAKNRRGQTPLDLAISVGDLKIGELLIQNGADVSTEELGPWGIVCAEKFKQEREELNYAK